MLSKLRLLFLKYDQFLRFCIVGAANTLITFTVSYILNHIVHMNEALASVIAYSAGIANGFFWSTRAVFKTKGTVGNLTKFILVNALMIGLNTLLVSIFSYRLGVDGFIAQVMATPFTLVGNFLLNKFWTFSKKNEKAVGEQ